MTGLPYEHAFASQNNHIHPSNRNTNHTTLRHQSVQTSNEWITGRRGNPTVVLPVFGHVDVAFVAPLFTPAVKQHQEQSVRCLQLAPVQ